MADAAAARGEEGGVGSSYQLRAASYELAAEPWMRGTHGELDVVHRAVVHALELAEEDVVRWCLG